jgi:hypothetical protein
MRTLRDNPTEEDDCDNDTDESNPSKLLLLNFHRVISPANLLRLNAFATESEPERVAYSPHGQLFSASYALGHL